MQDKIAGVHVARQEVTVLGAGLGMLAAEDRSKEIRQSALQQSNSQLRTTSALLSRENPQQCQFQARAAERTAG